MPRRLPREAALVLVALLFTLVSIAPIVWMTLSAFKTTAEMISIPPVWVPDFTHLANFADLLRDYGPFLVNSIVITLGATALALVLALPAAFGLVHFNLRWANPLADSILSTRMMPPIAAAVPLFIIFRGFGLLDTIAGMILVYAGFNLPFAIWVSMSFLRRVPAEIVEAARVEGASWFQVLTRVVMPVSRGGIVTVAMFVFIFAWNEFLLALFLTTRSAKTFPVIVSSFISTGKIYWELIAAASVLQCIPPIVFTLAMQRHIVSGLTMGALKE